MKVDTLKLDLDMTAELEMFQRIDQVLASIEERLDRLQGKAHGGIRIHIIGQVVSVEVDPAISEMDRSMIRAEAHAAANAVLRDMARRR